MLSVSYTHLDVYKRQCLHSSYYEKIDGEVSCIDEEIPYDIPDTWTWMRLENCCVKEIRRGKSPKYAEILSLIHI